MIRTSARPRGGLLILVLASLALTACVTNIDATRSFNPPPAEPLSAFQHFRLEPATVAPGADDGAANERAFAKIRQNLELNIGPLIERWNTEAGDATSGRTLVIQPHVRELKFVSAGARAFGGAMRGSSAVVLEVTFTDETTGGTVAQPEFFQRAAAMSGSWSVGGTDNHMLARIAQVAATYMSDNYDKAVGGPTYGGEPVE